MFGRPWSNFTKIALSWGVLTAAGLTSFVFARDTVISQRKEQMQLRRSIKEKVLREKEEEVAEARKQAAAAAAETEKRKLSAAAVDMAAPAQQQQLPQMDADKMRLVQELEIEMMTDMYARLTSACHKKCIAPKYREAELQKGESVCIDRCVAKYLEVHERIGKKLTELSMRDQEMQQKAMGVAT